MRIIGIKFQNLHSLKGIHEIRFDRPPFSESNLFVITGPTGAGKTTILDAVTAALYGRVHRHDRDACESMTRHTLESFSETEFEAGGKTYRARWSAKRGKRQSIDAKPKISMELSNAETGEIIASGQLKEVQRQIVDACGLDYDQFLRSVVLSQGDFTRFLKANESERSELLEKITDTAIYSQISSFIFEKSKAEQAELQLRMSRLSHVRLLTEEESAVFHERLSESVEKEKTLAAGKAAYEEQLRRLEKIDQLRERKRELSAEADRCRETYESNRLLFERLLRHKKMSVFKPTLAETDVHLKNIADAMQHLSLIEERLPNLRRAFETASQQFTAAEKAHGELLHRQREDESGIIETEKLDVLIGSKNDQTGLAGDSLRTFVEAGERLQRELREKEAAKDLLIREATEADAWLVEHAHEEGSERTISDFAALVEKTEMLVQRMQKIVEERTGAEEQEKAATTGVTESAEKTIINRRRADEIDQSIQSLRDESAAALAGKTLDETEAEIVRIPGLIGLYERQSELVDAMTRTRHRDAELAVEERQTVERQMLETEALKRLTGEYQQDREYLNILRENAKLRLLVRKYEDDRKELRHGQPCPLCGSIHHPIAENNDQHQTDEAEQKTEEQQRKVDLSAQRVNAAEIVLRDLQHRLKSIGELRERNSSDLRAATEAFEANNRRLREPLDPENREAISSAASTQKTALEELTRRVGFVRDREKRIRESENEANRLKEEIAAIESQMAQARLRAEYARASMAKLSADITSTEKETVESIAYMAEILKVLQIEFQPNRARAILDDLRKRSETYLARKEERRKRVAVLGEVEAELQNLRKNIAEKAEASTRAKEEFDTLRGEMIRLKEQRFALFGEKDTATERQQRTQAFRAAEELKDRLRKDAEEKGKETETAEADRVRLTTDVQRMRQHIDCLSEKLLRDIRAEGIESLEVLRELFMLNDEAERVDEIYRDWERRSTLVVRLIEETEDRLCAEALPESAEVTREALAEAVRKADAVLSESYRETGRVKQIIAEDDRCRMLYRQLTDEVDAQRWEADRWGKLSKLAGSADGKKFSRFAQGLTLERLVQLANRHIVKLTDRYLIRKMPGYDLELEIVDQYQADSVRPPSSLSGGESFLVSLALALGLSDLSGNKTRINSLFIDEGFGMLDNDTLDVALSALENLRAGGKTIGVISHVDALKERIGTQIRVIKQRGGHSKIKITAYGIDY